MVDQMLRWDIEFNTALMRAEAPHNKPLDYAEMYTEALSTVLGSFIGSGWSPDKLHNVTWYTFRMSYLKSPVGDTIIAWLKQRPDCVVLHNEVTGSFELGVLQV